MTPSPIAICFGCCKRRAQNDGDPCQRCGQPVMPALWSAEPERGRLSRVEAVLGVAAAAFLLAPALLYACFVGILAQDVLLEGTGWPKRIALVPLVAVLPFLAVWLTRRLFDLWGTRWTYRSADGTRWGTVSALFGWVLAGEGVCLTGLEPTAAGTTELCSDDAIQAGLSSVAAHLSRLQRAHGAAAYAPVDALMLAALAGLLARGSARIRKGQALRWNKRWLRPTRRPAPEAAFTIERDRALADGGAMERHILDTLQSIEDSLSLEGASAPPGYRAQAARPPVVLARLEDALVPALEAVAAGALATPAIGGAPVAVAVAIHDFAARDPARTEHLRRLLRAHAPMNQCHTPKPALTLS